MDNNLEINQLVPVGQNVRERKEHTIRRAISQTEIDRAANAITENIIAIKGSNIEVKQSERGLNNNIYQLLI